MQIEAKALASSVNEGGVADVRQSDMSAREFTFVEPGRDSLATLLEAAKLRKEAMAVGYGHLLQSETMSQAFSTVMAADPDSERVVLSWLTIPNEFAVGDFMSRMELETQLQIAFEQEPVEDGMLHAAEDIIREALTWRCRREVLEWLRSFALDEKDPALAASTLRCLGRVPDMGTAYWRGEIVGAALLADDLGMRDAAVQAAENWGDKGMVDVLRAHADPNPRIRSYVAAVIADLSE